MRAGDLKRRVYIDEAVDTQDQTTGDMVRSWRVLAYVWAKIKPMKGRERLIGGGPLAEMDTLITTRVLRGVVVGAKHRVRHVTEGGTTIYNVVSPAELLLEHREMELSCKSGQNEG